MKIKVSLQEGEIVCEVTVQPSYAVIHKFTVAEAKLLKAQLESAIKTYEDRK